VTGRAQPQVPFEQGDQLGRDETHLRRQLHVHLAQVAQPDGGVGGEDDDRLAVEQPVLGAAEGDDVDPHVGGDGAQAHVQGGRRVGQSGPVQVNPHPQLVGVGAQLGQLGRRVQRAQLGGLGDRHGQGLGPVLVPSTCGLTVDQLGGQLAVGRGDGEQLDAGHPLGGPVLVGVDVRRLGADHPTPRRQDGLQRHHVGSGAVEHREDLHLRTEVHRHHLVQPRRVGVRPVGHLMASVGRGDGGQDLRVGSGVVVGGEAAP
jgi:hypothetical protein